jgi:branched-chain amino acid transport system ATP-binding protein
MSLLSVENLVIKFGVLEALKGVSLELQEGEIAAVLGANGAGKTTLLRAISGLCSPDSGSITLNGRDLSKIPAHQLIREGIAHVPEGRHVFSTLSVEENLRIGVYGVRDLPAGKDYAKTRDFVYRLFPILKDRRRQLAGTLSGGEQQMLAIGRALVAKPRLLILDEPSLGLAPIVIKDIFKVIRQIHQTEGVSILLVEQNARQALSVAQRAYILELGRVALSGAAADLEKDERVRQAYLGGAAKPMVTA